MENKSAMYGTLSKSTDMSHAFSANVMNTVIRGMLTRVLCLKTTLRCLYSSSVLSICLQERSSKPSATSSQTNVNDLLVFVVGDVKINHHLRIEIKTVKKNNVVLFSETGLQ